MYSWICKFHTVLIHYEETRCMLLGSVRALCMSMLHFCSDSLWLPHFICQNWLQFHMMQAGSFVLMIWCLKNPDILFREYTRHGWWGWLDYDEKCVIVQIVIITMTYCVTCAVHLKSYFVHWLALPIDNIRLEMQFTWNC